MTTFVAEDFEAPNAVHQSTVSQEKVHALAAKHSSAQGARRKPALLGGALLEKITSITSHDPVASQALPEDGVDVINVGASAKTDLGKILSINSRFDFVMPGYGSFKSVGGFYNWLRSNRDDQFRRLWGQQCQAAGRKISKSSDNMPDPNWRILVAAATWLKFQDSRDNQLLMAESGQLPFRDYYVAEGTTIAKDTPMSYWYCEAIEEIRRVTVNNLKADLEAEPESPNFDTLPEMQPPGYQPRQNDRVRWSNKPRR